MERQSSVASSTEEVSGPDLSAGSQNPDHFGVFKDFDFLEYESESVEVLYYVIFLIDCFSCCFDMIYNIQFI